MTITDRRSFLASAGLLGATGSFLAAQTATAKNCAPSHGMTEEKFRAYIDAFNRDDYAAFGDYYTDDVVLVIAGKTELSGHQAIFDFYKKVKSQTQRTIEINKVIV